MAMTLVNKRVHEIPPPELRNNMKVMVDYRKSRKTEVAAGREEEAEMGEWNQPTGRPQLIELFTVDLLDRRSPERRGTA